MNNEGMFSLESAGGIPYPTTEKYDYVNWYTTTGLTDGSEYKTIRFNVRQDNLLLHWTNSFLEIQGQLKTKVGDTAIPTAANITLIHNAIPHLFDNVKLTVGSHLVENVNCPGHVSSMLYDILFPRSKAKIQGLEFMWYPDTAVEATVEDNTGFAARRKWIVDEPTTNGTFKLRLPLYMLFGFMENFLALKSYPIEIELVRGPDYPALFKDATAPEGKLKFNHLILNVPVVEPNNAILLESLKGLRDPKPYLYSFRQRHGMFCPVPHGIHDFQITFTTGTFTERPQMVFIGFQKAQTKDQKFNHALYSHENVETMYVRLNNHRYPTTLTKANFAENDNAFFYEQQQQCRANYLQYPARYTEGNMLSPANFKKLYTIYAFDCTKGDFALGGNSIVSSLHVHFKSASANNLIAYISWYSERTLELFTDGKPLNIKMQTDSYK